jgi:hypothetical protein
MHDATNYTINGSIDVDGDVYIVDTALTSLPLQFNKVTGDFVGSNNELTLMSNEVGGFDCCLII